MKTNSLKNSITILLLSVTLMAFSQKESKKYSEEFNVNKDVILEIEASNSEIDVTTWNKNKVLVEAYIEIEGLSKEEAQKYLNNYKFETLGNKSKVKVISGSNNSFRFGNNDFVIFNNDNFVMPHFEMPDIDIEMPNIDIQMPEMDFDNIFINLDDLEFDFDKYSKEGKKYFFTWKNDAKEITIKSKKEWEDFKKTKEYKKWKEEMKENKEKLKKELAKIKVEIGEVDKKAIKISLEKAKKAIQEIDMEKMKKDLSKVRKDFNKNFKENYIFDTNSNEFIINDKKVKITKKIKIKVPKGATFELNTRHSKVKLPKGKTSGKVSYGSFKASDIEGGNLKISYSPVTINSLKETTLSLNNVTDAKIASLTNSTLTSDSGGLEILEIFSGTNLKSSFGDVIIKKIDPALKNFVLTLNQSEATINLVGFKDKLKIDTQGNRSKIFNYDKLSEKGKGMLLKGSFIITSNSGNLIINAKYSELDIKQ